MERLVTQLLNHEGILVGFLRYQAGTERIETRSQFAQIASPNDIIAIITFSLDGGCGGHDYCIPHSRVETLFKDVKSGRPERADSDLRINPTRYSGNRKSDVLRAALTTRRLTKKWSLWWGYIVLDHKVNDEINISVRDKLKYKRLYGDRKQP